MRGFLGVLIAFCASFDSAAAEVRIKDITEIEGVRANDLVGYGLVVGLKGTGDGIRNSPYTQEAFTSLLERLGVNIQGENFNSRNVAAVIVTAALPPFARAGSRIDVNIAAIGDASSLLGGTLVMTPLRAGDGEVYAVAQGPVLASGVAAQGAAASVTFGAPTAGTIPEGARVEREAAFEFSSVARLRLSLRSPDMTTAIRVEDAINNALGNGAAAARDPATIDVDLKVAGLSAVRAVARIENLAIEPQARARVVIDQKSGTIVIGADVRVSRFAVTQGGLSITVRENPFVSQPNPFSQRGDTIVVPGTEVNVAERRTDNIAVVDGNIALGDLIEGLNALGVGPRELIDILNAIKAAGALHAELVVI
ncbi:MAG: flagellar basal body P-ring protein FlgI [Parvularculaceae bacterium]